MTQVRHLESCVGEEAKWGILQDSLKDAHILRRRADGASSSSDILRKGNTPASITNSVQPHDHTSTFLPSYTFSLMTCAKRHT